MDYKLVEKKDDFVKDTILVKAQEKTLNPFSYFENKQLQQELNKDAFA